MKNSEKNLQEEIGPTSEAARDHIREKRKEAERSIGSIAEAWNLIGIYAEEMKKKYTNWREYQLFAVLIGGTVRKGQMPYLDFPPPDSVKEFIERLSRGEKN